MKLLNEIELKLSKTIKSEDLNFCIVLSFFLFFLSFILSKGFIKNEELSDLVFFSSSVILIELVYLFISNNKINYKISSNKDNLIFLIFFLFFFIVWNKEPIYSYKNFILFLIGILLIVFNIFYFIKINLHYSKKLISNNTILQIIIISILLCGLFYQINYSSTYYLFLLICLSISTLIINFIFLKINKFIDILFSIIILLVSLKVFLLTSEKDAFHYSWILGPVNSISNNHQLLDNIPSQYGFLNLLVIDKLSRITNLNSEYVLVFLIILFFLIFFSLFYLQIKKIVNLPVAFSFSFLSFLIFANIGYSNLSGSMFIPSSSVLRFLPSLLTIIFFLKFLDKSNNNFLNFLIFTFFFLISIFWSFESAFFVIFSILSFIFFKIILNFFQSNSIKINLLRPEIVLFFFIIIFICYFILTVNFNLFFEHALNTKGPLSVEIENNKITLIYLLFLMLGYLIVRDSYNNKTFFYQNILWFSLLISYSSYFLLRSVDNNLINLLPFFIFILCTMQVSSNQIKFLRYNFIFILIFFTIISSLFSIILNKEKFHNKLISTNILVTPQYLSNSYKPKKEILKIIKNYPKTPLTLISGKTIHQKNFNLPSYGYGLPILPLEHFNVLEQDTKQKLVDEYFLYNDKHLILCLYDCKFYKSDKDSSIYSKIFLGKNIHFKKIGEDTSDDRIEILYLLSTS